VDAEYIRDIFSSLGPVAVRRMFGGAGIYFDGTMFALLADDVIYLKADAALVPDFEKAGSAPFAYTAKDGRPVVMSYWRLPDNLYDDPDELAHWARRSLTAARRGRR
jgi:DNA transformation protein and related proteins